MPIEFRCSRCGALLQTGDDTAGKQAKCPTCGLIQPIPSWPAPSPLAPPPSPEASLPGPPAGNPFTDSRLAQPQRPVPLDVNPYPSPSTSGSTFEQYPLGGGYRLGPPWEQEGASFATFISTTREMYSSVNFFFAEMRREGGLGAPLAYNLAGGILGTAAILCYQFGLQMLPLMLAGRAGAGNAAPVAGGFGVVAVVFLVAMPVGIVLQAFLASAVFHLVLMLFGGARFPYETTFRVVTYSSGATALLLLIPFCGQLIALVVNLVFVGIGLSCAHEISGGKAAAAVLLPFIACCGTFAIAYGTLIYFALRAA